MTTGFKAILSILLGSALTAQGSTVGVTPMQQVLTLLKGLSAKLAAEGAEEAAEYDKFACFCKEQADEKQYAIDKSDKKLAYLKAEIEQLSSAKKALESDMIDLSQEIRENAHDIEKKTDDREHARGKYEQAYNDVSEAINSCERAIQALKNSRTNLKGAKVTNFADVTSGLFDMVEDKPSLNEAPDAVALLSKIKQKVSGAPKFQYQSNDIIATVEDLLATFNSMKAGIDEDEHASNAQFEKSRLALVNIKKLSEKARAEKESIANAKTDELHEAVGFQQNEEADRQADWEFTQKLSIECEDKAELFDQNSKFRGDELRTLAEATRELKSGAVPKDKARRTHVTTRHEDEVHDTRTRHALEPADGISEIQTGKTSSQGPVTFVQINKVQHRVSEGEEVVERAHTFLVDAAERTESTALSAIAVRVAVSNAQGAGADNYVKVRGLIRDLLQKLEADALDEASHKTVCDEGIKKATGERDEANTQIEEFTGKITVLKSKAAVIYSDLAEIAELKKALLEAVELADKDEADFTKQKAMCDAGYESVSRAMEILNKFYPSARGFLQMGRWRPANASRDGNTVKDLAPDTFDSKYEGAKSESSGIIGILEVILADFERSAKKAEDDKIETLAALDAFQKSVAADVKQKYESIDKHDLDIVEFDSELTEEEKNLRSANKLLASSLKVLEGFQADCVAGEETWEERHEKRQDEINALNDAMKILQEWQPSA